MKKSISVFVIVMLLASCQLDKKYQYVETIIAVGLLSSKTSIKEKDPENIVARNDSIAYMMAFTKFCRAQKVDNDMLEAMGSNNNTRISFKLMDNNGVDITNSVIFNNKDSLEKEVKDRIFSRSNVFQEAIDRNKKKDDLEIEKNSTIVDPAQSIAYKLAVLEKGGYVSEDNLLVKRFDSLLGQLDDKYVENKQQLGDMTYKAKELLEKSGIKESMIKMMEGMNLLFNQVLENQKYAEYISAYITMREQGQTHDDAIKGLQALLGAIGVN